MELRHISIENIHDTKLNMRHDRKPPDVSDILPTVKAKGILQPLLVRPYAEGGDEAVEIVAGTAALLVRARHRGRAGQLRAAALRRDGNGRRRLGN